VPGVNLTALASDAQADNVTRKEGGLRAHAAGLASERSTTQARMQAAAASEAQERAFRRSQSLADQALRRRQIREEEEAAAVQRRLSVIAGGAAADQEEQRFYDRARFQTDENIRQQSALASLAQQEQPRSAQDVGLKPTALFGGRLISPERGASLNYEQPGKFAMSEDERKILRDLIEKLGDDPTTLDEEIRKVFGNRNRTASVGLFNEGYLPPGALEGP
jgi:hypothetical protein